MIDPFRQPSAQASASLREEVRRSSLARDRGSPASGDPFDEQFWNKLEYLAIVSRRIFSGRSRAERRSKKTGSGIEFADYRHYCAGDDYRHLDWNVYGRLGRLLTRLYEEEEDLAVYLLLDCSGSMSFGDPPKLGYAKQLAAALAYIGLGHLDRVSVLAFGEGIGARLPPARGRHYIFKVFDFLRPLTAAGRTDLGGAARTFVARTKRRGVVIFISDLYDHAGFEAGLRQLRYAGFETRLIHLRDENELRPPLPGEAVLVDVETGDRREVVLSPALLERYAAAQAAFGRRIEQFCTGLQIPLVSLSTRIPVEDAVLRILRRGGMVG
jgi:uncharacterized protein (DUF58 family)